MNLDELVGPETAAPSGCDRVGISGITADSREVRPGWLFAALRGYAVHRVHAGETRRHFGLALLHRLGRAAPLEGHDWLFRRR